MIGRHVSDITGTEAYETFKVHMVNCLAGKRVEFEQEVPYHTLGKRWVHVIYEPERGPDGEVTGLVAVIVDITTRKQAELDLAKARDEAVAASRAKDDFLAALSHELRTPLSPVLLVASDAVNNRLLPREIRETFEMIRTNVSLEARLIDDLLDLTSITRGKMPLEMQRVDIHEVLRDALANVRSELDTRQLELETELSAPQSIVLGDPVRLQQVLWNLLKNAVKFTPDGGWIHATTDSTSKPGSILIEVSDNGLGMSGEELEPGLRGLHAGRARQRHRLAPFRRPGPRARHLAPARRAALRPHLGRQPRPQPRVSVRRRAAARGRTGGRPHAAGGTSPGQGGASRSPGRQRRDPAGRGSRLHPRTPIRKLLLRRNYAVAAAASMAAARALAARQRFDFVISDVGLPDGDGYQLMAELRKIQPHLQGIAISGYGMDEDLQRSSAAGFSAHLVKPVSIAAVERALAGLRRPSAP